MDRSKKVSKKVYMIALVLVLILVLSVAIFAQCGQRSGERCGGVGEPAKPPPSKDLNLDDPKTWKPEDMKNGWIDLNKVDKSTLDKIKDKATRAKLEQVLKQAKPKDAAAFLKKNGYPIDQKNRLDLILYNRKTDGKVDALDFENKEGVKLGENEIEMPNGAKYLLTDVHKAEKVGLHRGLLEVTTRDKESQIAYRIHAGKFRFNGDGVLIEGLEGEKATVKIARSSNVPGSPGEVIEQEYSVRMSGGRAEVYFDKDKCTGASTCVEIAELFGANDIKGIVKKGDDLDFKFNDPTVASARFFREKGSKLVATREDIGVGIGGSVIGDDTTDHFRIQPGKNGDGSNTPFNWGNVDVEFNMITPRTLHHHKGYEVEEGRISVFRIQNGEFKSVGETTYGRVFSKVLFTTFKNFKIEFSRDTIVTQSYRVGNAEVIHTIDDNGIQDLGIIVREPDGRQYVLSEFSLDRYNNPLPFEQRGFLMVEKKEDGKFERREIGFSNLNDNFRELYEQAHAKRKGYTTHVKEKAPCKQGILTGDLYRGNHGGRKVICE